MPRTRRARWSLAVAVGAIVMLTLASGSSRRALAHTEVQRSSPAPGAQVEGEVDSIELVFLGPVQPEITITVDGPSGDPVSGLGDAGVGGDGIVARVAFDALTAAGTYTVTYQYVAEDGARQRGSYTFRHTGEGLAGEGDDGVGAPGLVGAAGFAALVVSAAVVARRRQPS